MRTKEELIQFLHNVAGEDSITVNHETGKIDIKPYTINNTTHENGHASGEIRFKGEHFDDFNHSDISMVRAIVDSLNYAYSQSIKDCLAIDPDMLSQYKMTRFKFT
jgi:hypothetical protein